MEELNIARADARNVPALEGMTGKPEATNDLLVFSDGLKQMGSSLQGMEIAQKNEEARQVNQERYRVEALKQEKATQKGLDETRAAYLSNAYGNVPWLEMTKEAQQSIVESPFELQDKAKLTFKEIDSKSLKKAYKLQHIDNRLLSQQKNFDAVTPTLVNEIFKEYKNTPFSGGNFIDYANTKLEDIKLEQNQLYNYKDIDPSILGEALKKRPKDYTNFYANVALKQQEKEEQDKKQTIQISIDSYDGKIDTPKGIDALIKSITHTKVNEELKLTGITRDEAQLQLVRHLQRNLQDATSLTAEVFQFQKAFMGVNQEKGRVFFDRTTVGPEWEQWYKDSVKKYNSLITTSASASSAERIRKTKTTKTNANRILITADIAVKIKPAAITEQNKNREEKINRADILQNTFQNLVSLETTETFAAAGGDETNKLLVLIETVRQEIDKSTESSTSYTPDATIVEEKTQAFEKEIAEFSDVEVDQKRLDLKSTYRHPWEHKMHETVLGKREAEITQSTTSAKATLALVSANETKDIKKKADNSTKEKDRIVTKFTNPKSTETVRGTSVSSEWTTKDYELAVINVTNNALLTGEDPARLLSFLGTKQTKSKNQDSLKTDSIKHAGIYNRLTDFKFNDDGSPDNTSIKQLENEITTHTWTDTALRGQLTTLLSARKRSAVEFKTALKQVKRENLYNKGLKKKLDPVNTEIQELIHKVAIKKLTGQEAITQLNALKTRFETDNRTTIDIGTALKNKVDYEETFNKGQEDINSQRTEKEIARLKKAEKLASKKQDEVRKIATVNIMKQYVTVMSDPKKLKDKKIVTALIEKITDTKVLKIYDDTSQLPETLIDPDTQRRLILALQATVLEKSNPENIDSDIENVLQIHRNFKSIEEEEPGSDRIARIEAQREYIYNSFIEGKLSITLYRTERDELEKIEKGDKIDTKSPVRVGETAIKLAFQNKLDLRRDNSRYLPPKEATKLYNEITQYFAQSWAEKAEGLAGEDIAVQTKEVLALANSLTRIHPDDKQHPIEGMNQRLKAFNMSRQKFAALGIPPVERRDPTIIYNYDTGVQTTRGGEKVILINKKKGLSQAELELERDVQEEKDKQASDNASNARR